MFEYSLGSAREGVVWYRLARRVLGHEVVAHREDSPQQIVRLPTASIPHERRRNL